MKTWHVIAFLVVCCMVSGGQERGQTPSGATVTVVGPKVYKPGSTLKLIVHLTPAPNNYGGGDVVVSVVNSATPTPDSGEGTQRLARAPLRDGESDYDFQIPITWDLQSGDWKAAWVEFGRASSTRIPFVEHNTFKIDTDEPPITVTLSGPKTVENGTEGTFHVIVDKAFIPTSAQACEDALNISFYPSGSPKGAQQYQSIRLKPGTVSYDVTFQLLPDAGPTGQWSAEVTSFKEPTQGQPMRQLHFLCPRPRNLVGQKILTFEVLPAANLVVPKAAQVTLNPNAIDLLRVQASSLQRRIEDLRGNLSQGTREDNKELLTRAVKGALQSLDATEREFRDLERSPTQQENSDVFFGDLRNSYLELEGQLKAEFRETPGYTLAADRKLTYPLMSRAVLHALEQNKLAYTIVADAESLVFDLDVSSVPPGATVSYRKKGDPFKKAPKSTNCTIKSLVYAIWTVRIERAGYDAVDVDHDPFRETNHSITVTLPNKK